MFRFRPSIHFEACTPVSSEALRLFGYCLMFALVVQAGVLRLPPSQIRHPPNAAHVKKIVATFVLIGFRCRTYEGKTYLDWVRPFLIITALTALPTTFSFLSLFRKKLLFHAVLVFVTPLLICRNKFLGCFHPSKYHQACSNRLYTTSL